MFKFTDVTATVAQLTSYNRSRTEYLTPSEILRTVYVYFRRDFDRPNTFAVRFSLVQVGSLWSHARSKSRSVHFGSTWRLFT